MIKAIRSRERRCIFAKRSSIATAPDTSRCVSPATDPIRLVWRQKSSSPAEYLKPYPRLMRFEPSPRIPPPTSSSLSVTLFDLPLSSTIRNTTGEPLLCLDEIRPRTNLVRRETYAGLRPDHHGFYVLL